MLGIDLRIRLPDQNLRIARLAKKTSPQLSQSNRLRFAPTCNQNLIRLLLLSVYSFFLSIWAIQLHHMSTLSGRYRE